MKLADMKIPKKTKAELKKEYNSARDAGKV